MARLALNKASLTKQTQQLKLYEEVLPSLDLKRRQIMAEQSKARKALAEIRQQLDGVEESIARDLLMLSNEHIDLTDIVKCSIVDLGEENVMGTRLPKINKIEVAVYPYAFLGKPHWVDRLVELMQKVLEIRVQIQVAEQRVGLLDQAAKTITQRVNLFDKVLIPQTQANIKKIQIFMSDAERASVVNSKISKRKKAVLA